MLAAVAPLPWRLCPGKEVTREQEQLILRLWREWCKVWPEQYGHASLEVKPEGYDPVFDVIPSQAYKDFYLEVVCDHPTLRQLNVFEVVDTALNQIRAPETVPANADIRPARAADHPRVATVELEQADATAKPAAAPPHADDQQAESA